MARKIQELLNGQTILMVTPGDLKEFALAVADEVSNSKLEDQRLFTPEEFAKRHSVNVSTLWRWRKAGVLKATQIGGSVFYKECDLRKETV